MGTQMKEPTGAEAAHTSAARATRRNQFTPRRCNDEHVGRAYVRVLIRRQPGQRRSEDEAQPVAILSFAKANLAPADNIGEKKTC